MDEKSMTDEKQINPDKLFQLFNNVQKINYENKHKQIQIDKMNGSMMLWCANSIQLILKQIFACAQLIC